MHRALGSVAWRAFRPNRACTSGALMERNFSAAAATHPHGPADPYDVVVFGGGMVGIVLAALLGELEQLPASLQSAHLSSCANRLHASFMPDKDGCGLLPLSNRTLFHICRDASGDEKPKACSR